jgi:hypothetical protein
MFLKKVLLFWLLILITKIESNWWSLGLDGMNSRIQSLKTFQNETTKERSFGGRVHFFNKMCFNKNIFRSPVQRKLCLKDSNILLPILSDAAKLTIKECQYQFKNERWNCTSFNRVNIFGKIAFTSNFYFL